MKMSEKRVVKSPEIYVRDSGLVHMLLGIGSYEELLSSPKCGASGKSFALENHLSAVPERTHASFYRTAAGA